MTENKISAHTGVSCNIETKRHLASEKESR